MKKSIFALGLIILFANSLVAQTNFEIFLIEGYKEFLKGNYDAAVKDYNYANNKCEDKPSTLDIKDSIDKAYESKIYKNAAELEFGKKNYNVALGFYKKNYTNNPADAFAKSQYQECIKRLNCFTEARSAGLSKMELADYSGAVSDFANAANCDFIPEFTDIKMQTAKADTCSKYKNLADVNFQNQYYKSAMANYNKVLVYNPNDAYCKTQIEIAIRNYYPKTIIVDYSTQILCPYGFTIGYLRKDGIIMHARFDYRKPEISYSLLLGYAREVYKIKSNMLLLSAAAGLGKYADYWYQYGEDFQRSKYPHGFQFESNLIFKSSAYNVGLGLIVPTFNFQYTSFSVSFGLNINLKDK